MQSLQLEPHDTRTSPWYCYVIPFLIICISAFTCFYRLHAPSMWLDEIYCRYFSQQSVNAILNSANFHIQLTHGYFILDKVSEFLFGDIDFGIRFIDAIAAVGTVCFAYLLGTTLFSRSAGILCALALSVNPLFVSYCQYNRIYHVGGFAFIAVYYSFVRFVETRRRIFWFLIILFSVFFLRTHEYSPVSLGLLGIILGVLMLLSMMPASWRPYTITRSTVLWLIGAALVAALLWYPYTFRFIIWALEGKRTDNNFDGFWPGPFPVTVMSVINFARDNFLVPFCQLVETWQVWLIAAAAIIGDLWYRRGRALIYYLYCIAVTLIIIFVMNAAHAAVMAKRLIYLEPPTFLFIACGICTLPRIVADIVLWIGGCIARTKTNRVIRYLALLTKIILWWWLLWTVVRPVITQSIYELGQYYFKERAVYKLTSRFLVSHAAIGDTLWWYPPVNDSWLPEFSYLPKTAWVKPVPKDYNDINTKSIMQVLEKGNTLWLHQLSPSRYGFSPSTYIELPMAGKITYVIKPEYLSNTAVRLRDEKVMLNSIIHLSQYPEISATRQLTKLLLAAGKTKEADNVIDFIGSFNASRDAMFFAREYYAGRGMPQAGDKYLSRFADFYWFVPSVQIEIAYAALADGLYSDAIRLAKRYSIISKDANAAAAEILARSYWAVTNYSTCKYWTDQTISRLKKLPEMSAGDVARFSAATNMYAKLVPYISGSYVSITNMLFEWTQSRDAQIVSDIAYSISNVVIDASERKRFVRSCDKDVNGDRILKLLAVALQNTTDTNKLMTALIQMRNNVTADNWPLYAAACLILAPKNQQALSVSLDTILTMVSVQDADTLTNVTIVKSGWASEKCPLLMAASPTATNWSARLSVALPEPGNYDIYIALASESNRSFSVSINDTIVCTNSAFDTGNLHHSHVRKFHIGVQPLTTHAKILVYSQIAVAPHISSFVFSRRSSTNVVTRLHTTVDALVQRKHLQPMTNQLSPTTPVHILCNGKFTEGMTGWRYWGDTSFVNGVSAVAKVLRIENANSAMIGLAQHVNVTSGWVYRLSGSARSMATNNPAILFGGRIALFMPPQPEQQLVWMSEYNNWWPKSLVFTNQVTGTAVVYVHMGYGKVASTGEFSDIRLERIAE